MGSTSTHPRVTTMVGTDEIWDVQLGKGVDKDLKAF